MFKVEKILKDRLDSIPSPSPSVKIQIMGGKVGLGCKGKTLLGAVNKLVLPKKIKTKNSNVYDSLKVMRSNPGYLLKSSLLYLKFGYSEKATKFEKNLPLKI